MNELVRDTENGMAQQGKQTALASVIPFKTIPHDHNLLLATNWIILHELYDDGLLIHRKYGISEAMYVQNVTVPPSTTCIKDERIIEVSNTDQVRIINQVYLRF